jgi:hypothetical protein
MPSSSEFQKNNEYIFWYKYVPCTIWYTYTKKKKKKKSGVGCGGEKIKKNKKNKSLFI